MKHTLSSTMRLRLQLLSGALRDQPIKWAIVILAITVGVALGLAVHLIHKQALEQFDAGVRQFSGNADLQLVPHGRYLRDEDLGLVSQLSGVSVTSPILEADIYVPELQTTVKWLGLDVFRAALVTPDMIGELDSTKDRLAFLLPDSIFISPAINQQLENPSAPSKPSNTTLTSQHNGKLHTWTVVGRLTQTDNARMVVVSDIAGTQVNFGLVGKLSRIDLKLGEGISVAEFRSKHENTLSNVGRLETTTEQTSRGATVSKAYRANLSILAMVALLTGGFLSFSTQMLSVAQRSRQWALLGAIGMSQRALERQIYFESCISGLAGGVLGVGFGWWLATLILSYMGSDLGAGYFSGHAQTISLNTGEVAVFILFALIATTAGALLPAKQASQAALSGRLRSGSEEAGLTFTKNSTPIAAGLLIAALISVWLPPIDDLPIGGYLGIALGLFGGIALVGQVVTWIVIPPKRLVRLTDLAATRLAATPNLLAIGLAGVVASFALVVAMHVMIYSFRNSLDDWLTKVLPAPLYVSLNENSSLTELPQALLAELGQLPHERTQLWGQQDLIIQPNRPPVKLIIRPINMLDAADTLPLTGPSLAQLDDGYQPIWPSEPAANIYDYRVGDKLKLTIDANTTIQAQVAGIWRDYGRQHGAMVVSQKAMFESAQYQIPPTQMAIWPTENGMDTWLTHIATFVKSHGLDGQIRVARPEAIRQLSLDIFDRSFAVTYLLEAAAIIIGLFGVATTFSAIAMSRQREFALISAMGGTPGNLPRLAIAEGVLSSWVATLVGLVLGILFAAVLVFIVNPQSFHWTMQWSIPWRDLIVMAITLMLCATMTVTLSMRKAISRQPISLLKEDWA